MTPARAPFDVSLILEFHFTDDRNGKTFRGHHVSLTRDEVRAFTQELNALRELLGDGVKRRLPSEIETGHIMSFRRPVYCRKSLGAGERLRLDELVLLRPNHGIDARRLDRIAGRRASRDFRALEPLDVLGPPERPS